MALSYEERLKELYMFTVKQRRLQGYRGIGMLEKSLKQCRIHVPVGMT